MCKPGRGLYYTRCLLLASAVQTDRYKTIAGRHPSPGGFPLQISKLQTSLRQVSPPRANCARGSMLRGNELACAQSTSTAAIDLCVLASGHAHVPAHCAVHASGQWTRAYRERPDSFAYSSRYLRTANRNRSGPLKKSPRRSPGQCTGPFLPVPQGVHLWHPDASRLYTREITSAWQVCLLGTPDAQVVRYMVTGSAMRTMGTPRSADIFASESNRDEREIDEGTQKQ